MFYKYNRKERKKQLQVVYSEEESAWSSVTLVAWWYEVNHAGMTIWKVLYRRKHWPLTASVVNLLKSSSEAPHDLCCRVHGAAWTFKSLAGIIFTFLYVLSIWKQIWHHIVVLNLLILWTGYAIGLAVGRRRPWWAPSLTTVILFSINTSFCNLS
jgi:hypothetical protein